MATLEYLVTHQERINRKVDKRLTLVSKCEFKTDIMTILVPETLKIARVIGGKEFIT